VRFLHIGMNRYFRSFRTILSRQIVTARARQYTSNLATGGRFEKDQIMRKIWQTWRRRDSYREVLAPIALAEPMPTCCRDVRISLVTDNDSKCPVTAKRRYVSEGEALATAAHQIATANAPKDLRAYFCQWCDAWHLTKDAGRRRDRRS
jgi:hypothetical protein